MVKAVQLGLAVVAVIGCGACGTASALYRGTVTVADEAGHSFDATEAANETVPISAAEVRMSGVSIDGTCDELWKASLPTGYEGHRPEARTNHVGHYQVYTVYPGIIGSSSKRLLCVRHPDFEPYEYTAIDGTSKDPRNGEKFLNIRLKPRQQAGEVRRDVR